MYAKQLKYVYIENKNVSKLSSLVKVSINLLNEQAFPQVPKCLNDFALQST